MASESNSSSASKGDALVRVMVTSKPNRRIRL